MGRPHTKDSSTTASPVSPGAHDDRLTVRLPKSGIVKAEPIGTGLLDVPSWTVAVGGTGVAVSVAVGVRVGRGVEVGRGVDVGRRVLVGGTVGVGGVLGGHPVRLGAGTYGRGVFDGCRVGKRVGVVTGNARAEVKRT